VIGSMVRGRCPRDHLTARKKKVSDPRFAIPGGGEQQVCGEHAGNVRPVKMEVGKGLQRGDSEKNRTNIKNLTEPQGKRDNQKALSRSSYMAWRDHRRKIFGTVGGVSIKRDAKAREGREGVGK